MPSHRETKNMPYTAQQMLGIVLDIEKYPKFLPWCRAAKITNRIKDGHLEADLVISFKAFTQKYRSDVRFCEIEGKHEVYVASIDGPFKSLVNNWTFKDLPNSNSCEVSFFIDFEFQSKILGKMIGPIFSKATDKMANAFGKRAEELYG